MDYLLAHTLPDHLPALLAEMADARRDEARDLHGGQIGRAQQQANVRWVDGRGLYLNQHFVRPWRGHGCRLQADLQGAIGLYKRAQLQRGGRDGWVHGGLAVG